jgi:hypothetical protein
VDIETNPGSGAAVRRLFAVAMKAREEAQQRTEPLESEAYDDVFRRMLESVRATQKRLARERKLAEMQWAALGKHPQARRLMMVRNDRRLQTWGLYQILLEKSRSLAEEAPGAAAEVAELALAVAGSLDPEEHNEERTADFRAGALAALADAKRRLSERGAAWQAFTAAHDSLKAGTGDPLDRAELEILRARLLRDFGRQEEARDALRRANHLFRRIGDRRFEKGDPSLEETGQVAMQRRQGRR